MRHGVYYAPKVMFLGDKARIGDQVSAPMSSFTNVDGAADAANTPIVGATQAVLLVTAVGPEDLAGTITGAMVGPALVPVQVPIRASVSRSAVTNVARGGVQVS